MKSAKNENPALLCQGKKRITELKKNIIPEALVTALFTLAQSELNLAKNTKEAYTVDELKLVVNLLLH